MIPSRKRYSRDLYGLYHGLSQNAENTATGLGMLADRAEEIGHPLAPLYRQMFENSGNEASLPNPRGSAWFTSGHHSIWIPGPTRLSNILLQHTFTPLSDGRVRINLSADPMESSKGKQTARGAAIVPHNEAEQYVNGIIQTLSGEPDTDTEHTSGNWFWGHPTEDNPYPPRQRTDNPVSDLREAVRQTYQPPEPTPMSRRRYATARDVVTQPPGASRGAVPHSWGEFRGRSPNRTWTHPANESLYPSLAGTRLAVVLHEIRDNLGASDPRLKELADRALQGDFGREGRDVFVDIRDLLRHRASIDTVSPQGQLAGRLANQYAWHRVGAGIKLDRVVGDAVRKMASKGRLANSGQEVRAAHNFFGIGAVERGHDAAKQKQFLDTLRQHVQNSLFSAKGTGDTYALHAPQFTDAMLLRSLRRQAEAEHNIEQLGTGSSKAEVPLSRFEGSWNTPATTPTGRVSTKAVSSQYRRPTRRYAMFGLLNRGGNQPRVNGIRYTSHPPEQRGRYSVNDHLAANMEKSAVRHALVTLGIIPPRRGEDPTEYERGVRQVTEHFLNLARNHVHQNPNDELSRRYLSAANNLVVPTGDTDVTGPGGQVESVNLGKPPEDYTGLLGLSVGVTPLVRRIAHDKGIKFKDTSTPAGVVPVHNVEEPIDLDLLEPHGGTEPETVNNPVSWLGREGETVEHLGSPEDFLGSTAPQLGLRLIPPTRRQPVDPAAVKQSLANHFDEAFSRGETSPKETSASALQMLQQKHGLSPEDARRHLRNFVRGQRKPVAEAPQPTKRVWPPVSRKQRADKYAAYRAPTGGMVVRGTNYKGGEMVPNMEGKFANPPEKKFDPAKLAKIRRRMMVGVMDAGTGGVTLPGSVVSTKKST